MLRYLALLRGKDHLAESTTFSLLDAKTEFVYLLACSVLFFPLYFAISVYPVFIYMLVTINMLAHLTCRGAMHATPGWMRAQGSVVELQPVRWNASPTDPLGSPDGDDI